MNNADMPASPQSGTEGMSGDLNSSEDWGGKGLTKREHFAAMAMQGLITLKGSDCMDKDITAKQCVSMADALLKALGEGK
jgi:hypothetical protein